MIIDQYVPDYFLMRLGARCFVSGLKNIREIQNVITRKTYIYIYIVVRNYYGVIPPVKPFCGNLPNVILA
mgnify:CR=1 FL=1